MHRINIAVLSAVTLLVACGSLRSGDAERLLRERVGSGEPVYLRVFMPPYEGTDQTTALAQLGLIAFTAGDFAKDRQSRSGVTAAGTALGLSLKDGDLVTGKLCDVVFGTISMLGKAEGDSVKVVQATYGLRHAAPTPLLDKVRGTKAIDADACDPAKVYPRQAQFVRTAGTWRLNNPPKIPAGLSTAVRYDYDKVGRRTGATNEMTILQPVDPDGDPVDVSWTGELFDGKRLAPMTMLKAAGLKATFPGMSGAIVFAIARDRFGGVDTARFCFRSDEFSC